MQYAPLLKKLNTEPAYIRPLPNGKLSEFFSAYEWLRGHWIPQGYRFNGANIWTVIGLTWRILYPPNHPIVKRASGVHDWLYENQTFDRKLADLVFRELLIADGCPRWKAAVMYRALRVGGWAAWNKAKRKLKDA